MTLSTLEGSASGCAAPSWPMAALGQIRSQISCSTRKPSEVFIDALALLLERVEHLIEPLLRILHAAPYFYARHADTTTLRG